MGCSLLWHVRGAGKLKRGDAFFFRGDLGRAGGDFAPFLVDRPRDGRTPCPPHQHRGAGATPRAAAPPHPCPTHPPTYVRPGLGSFRADKLALTSCGNLWGAYSLWVRKAHCDGVEIIGSVDPARHGSVASDALRQRLAASAAGPADAWPSPPLVPAAAPVQGAAAVAAS